MQVCCISIAKSLEILQSYTRPSKLYPGFIVDVFFNQDAEVFFEENALENVGHIVLGPMSKWKNHKCTNQSENCKSTGIGSVITIPVWSSHANQIVKCRKIMNSRDFILDFSHRFEIWPADVQQWKKREPSGYISDAAVSGFREILL